MMQESSTPPPTIAQFWIIYFSFLMALVVYAGLLLSGVMGQSDEHAAVSFVLLVLAASGVGATIIGLIIVYTMPGPRGWREDLDKLIVDPSGGKPEEPMAYLARCQARLIVGIAFIEALGVMGFVSPFLGGSTAFAMSLIAASFVGVLVLLPKVARITADVRRMKDDKAASSGPILQ